MHQITITSRFQFSTANWPADSAAMQSVLAALGFSLIVTGYNATEDGITIQVDVLLTSDQCSALATAWGPGIAVTAS
jgi:hypothetical protein